MSTFMFLHIYIHMLIVITSEINHVVQRKLPNCIYQTGNKFLITASEYKFWSKTQNYMML